MHISGKLKRLLGRDAPPEVPRKSDKREPSLSGKEAIDDRRRGIRETASSLRERGIDVDRDWVVVHYLTFSSVDAAVSTARELLESKSAKGMNVLASVTDRTSLEDFLETDGVVSTLKAEMKDRARQVLEGGAGSLAMITVLQPLSDDDRMFAIRDELLRLASHRGGTYGDFLVAQ